jgi:serine/threonine-protein kinase
VSTERGDEQRDTIERLVGSVVCEKYRVDRMLGQGGMGAVFQATNLAIGKRVALKFLSREAAKDRAAAERFQREALAASVVESAHIVQIFDSGTSADGLPFLVMELLTGEDLRARLKREGALSIEETANIAVQVLRGLTRAHAAGIVHRDLKPDNVFLCRRDDDSLLAKIVDFGISKLGRSSALDTLTQRGTVLGTAYYMSPEQAQAFADIDGRTDLFSVGAIVFECLAGRPPHARPTYEAVLIAICTKDAEDVRNLAPDVPEALARVVHRALARDRAERYQSAAEMLEELIVAVPSAFVAPFGATPSGARLRSSASLEIDSAAAFASTSRTPSAVRRRRVGSIATGIGALFAGFALTALFVRQRSELEPEKPATALPQPSAPATLNPVVAPSSDPSSPSSSSRPAVDPIAQLPSATPARVAPSTSTATTNTVAQAPAKRARRERPSNRPASTTSPTLGVAKGLELSTKEP